MCKHTEEQLAEIIAEHHEPKPVNTPSDPQIFYSPKFWWYWDSCKQDWYPVNALSNCRMSKLLRESIRKLGGRVELKCGSTAWKDDDNWFCEFGVPNWDDTDWRGIPPLTTFRSLAKTEELAVALTWLQYKGILSYQEAKAQSSRD